MKITSVDVFDIRFPTSKTLAGSDAVHKDPDYSCAYVVINTDAEDEKNGHGLTFSLGRGNEVICKAIEAFSDLLIGKDFESDILKDMMNQKTMQAFITNLRRMVSCDGLDRERRYSYGGGKYTPSNPVFRKCRVFFFYRLYNDLLLLTWEPYVVRVQY